MTSPIRLLIEAALEYRFAGAAPVLLQLEVAQLPDQQLVEDRLTVTSPEPLVRIEGEGGVGVRCWAWGEGDFSAAYQATIDLLPRAVELAGLQRDPLHALDASVVPFLWPSVYCPAGAFELFVERQFADYAGGDRIERMVQWLREHIDYRSGTSDATTTATESFVRRAGVCRDFAHLLITFARASGIPARMVSAYALDLQPPDFHAVVEVWLDGTWHLVDPTGLVPVKNLVRIGIGRDATDISFMTIWGAAELVSQSVSVKRIDDL
jgi:transglutaminase-like putative cysteine protease